MAPCQLSTSCVRLAAADPQAPAPEALRGDVDPEPAQQRPVHPGPGVHFPAALRQQQRHSESSQDQQGRQGSAEAERRHSALPGEPAQLLRVLRFVEALQQPAKIRQVAEELSSSAATVLDVNKRRIRPVENHQVYRNLTVDLHQAR